MKSRLRVSGFLSWNFGPLPEFYMVNPLVNQTQDNLLKTTKRIVKSRRTILVSLESIKSEFVSKDARIKFKPPSGFKSESSNRTNRQEQIEERRTICQVSVTNIYI